MSEDKTWGVKASPSVREKANQLFAASGKEKKQWFEDLINSAEMQALVNGQTDPAYQKEMQEIERHFNRVNEIMVNLVKRASHDKEEMARNHEKEIATYAERITQAEATAAEYKQSAKEAAARADQLEKENEEVKKQLQDVRQANDQAQELIEQYKNEIVTLSEQLNKQREAVEENQVLRLENSDLKHRLEQVTASLERQEQEHEKQITDLAQKKQLECKEIRLQEQQKHQEETRSLQNEFYQKIQALNEKAEVRESKYEAKQEEQQKQIQELTYQLQQAEKDNHALVDQLQEKDKHIMAHAAKGQEYQEQIQALTEQIQQLSEKK